MGLLCGNDPKQSLHDSLSLYCLASASAESYGQAGILAPGESSANSSEIRVRRSGLQAGFVAREDLPPSLMPILQGIDKSVSKQNLTTEVMVGLLTLLCIILVSIVVYLCYTRGISSLSRYVM